MAYKTSSARRDFDAAIEEILQTILQLRHIPKTSKARDYVLSCSILFCSAYIEAYFEDIFGLFASAVSQPNTKVSKLPEHLRAYLFGLNEQLVSTYSQYVAFRDEKKLIKDISKYFNNRYASLANHTANTPTIEGHKIWKDCKYPSPENINALFSRFGIKIFDELNRRAKRNIELDLESFNSLRTSLAHSGLGPAINETDIRRHIRKMRELIGFLDRVCYSLTCKTLSDRAWAKNIV
jgi:hypothetical protein